MEPRLNPFAAAPALVKQYIDFSKSIIASGLEPDLLHLVEIRASQINGCANCLNMHTAEARKGGIYMMRNPDKLRHLESTIH